MKFLLFIFFIFLYSFFKINSFSGGSYFDDKKKIDPFTTPGTIKEKEDTYYKSLPCLYRKIEVMGNTLFESIITKDRKKEGELEPYEKRDICNYNKETNVTQTSSQWKDPIEKQEDSYEKYYDEATTVDQKSVWEDSMEKQYHLEDTIEKSVNIERTFDFKEISEFFKTNIGNKIQIKSTTIHDITDTPGFMQQLNIFFKKIRDPLFRGREFIFHQQVENEKKVVKLLNIIDENSYFKEEIEKEVNKGKTKFEIYFSENDIKSKMKNIIIDLFIYKINENDSSLFLKILLYHNDKTYIYQDRKITSNNQKTSKNIRIENGELIILFIDKTIYKKSLRLNIDPIIENELRKTI